MFGYILPEKPEMKMREYELFRAFYCGLCKSLGEHHGQVTRLTLNYDTTFLALLLTLIDGKKVQIRRERCIAHPTKKRPMIKNNPCIEYASDINVILAYYHLKDDWRDDSSIPSAAGMLALKKSFQKIQNKHPDKCGIIEKYLADLSILEVKKCTSLDQAAEPFAKLMEEITSYMPVCKDDGELKILKWLGYNLGKWIYILDAFDDIEKDIKKKTYNPFLCQFAYENEPVEPFKMKVKVKAEFILTYCLSEISKAFELLSVKKEDAGIYHDLTSILENIIYLGMLRKTEQILGIRSCEHLEKSI